ncbi:hypothetical protein HZA75_04490 [Candidatus Roizmanbacteria bacterium]|nr:hypothetical protein [Candidatus Roizmanbacteria bacterium]
MNDKNGINIIRNIRTDKGGEDDIYTGEIDNIKELKDNEMYLTNLKETNPPQFFKYYCQLLIEVSKKEKITRQTTAYMIAGWMFHIKLRSIPEIKEIVFLAGRLELPYRHATDIGDKHAYDMEWNKLVDKVNNLKF